MFAIVNGKIITPLEEIENGTILIEDQKIQEIGRRESAVVPEGAKILDAGGKLSALVLSTFTFMGQRATILPRQLRRQYRK